MLMVQGMVNTSRPSLFLIISFVMIALQLWETSIVLKSKILFSVTNSFMNMEKRNISNNASMRGQLISRDLNTNRSFLNLSSSIFFMRSWGNGGDILGKGCITFGVEICLSISFCVASSSILLSSSYSWFSSFPDTFLIVIFRYE